MSRATNNDLNKHQDGANPIRAMTGTNMRINSSTARRDGTRTNRGAWKIGEADPIIITIRNGVKM